MHERVVLVEQSRWLALQGCVPSVPLWHRNRCWAVQGLTRHGKKNHDQDLYVCNLVQHPAFILHGDSTVSTLSL